MSDGPLERIDSRTESRIAFLSIDIDTFRDPDGRCHERVAVRHPGAVGVVPGEFTSPGGGGMSLPRLKKLEKFFQVIHHRRP